MKFGGGAQTRNLRPNLLDLHHLRTPSFNHVQSTTFCPNSVTMPPSLHPQIVARSTTRLFSTSQPAHAKLPPCPPYPYPRAQWYKKQDRGLFGGQTIRFGNQISEEYDNKSSRTWHPNVQNKKLFSVALNQHIQVKTTTRVLRTIDKLGGLDEYLVGDKTARIKALGPVGWRMRWRVLHTPMMEKRLRKTGNALGVGDMSQGTPTGLLPRASKNAQKTRPDLRTDAKGAAAAVAEQVVEGAKEAMAEATGEKGTKSVAASGTASEADETLEIDDVAEPEDSEPTIKDTKLPEASRPSI